MIFLVCIEVIVRFLEFISFTLLIWSITIIDQKHFFEVYLIYRVGLVSSI